MEGNIHYGATYALGRLVGISRNVAETIAWADQFTDDNTEAGLHGLQTSSAVLGNWKIRQIQATVIVPFHFIYGNDKDNPYAVTQHSPNSQTLLGVALGDPYQFGIALHVLQDTYSHQGFTGWEEPFNSCSNLVGVLTPNIGHADIGHKPDIPNIKWTDPRSGLLIDNRLRAIECCKATYVYLTRFNCNKAKTEWSEIESGLIEIFARNTRDYSKDCAWRKERLKKLAGGGRDYKQVKRDKDKFIAAARKHLSKAMALMN